MALKGAVVEPAGDRKAVGVAVDEKARVELVERVGQPLQVLAIGLGRDARCLRSGRASRAPRRRPRRSGRSAPGGARAPRARRAPPARYAGSRSKAAASAGGRAHGRADEVRARALSQRAQRGELEAGSSWRAVGDPDQVDERRARDGQAVVEVEAHGVGAQVGVAAGGGGPRRDDDVGVVGQAPRLPRVKFRAPRLVDAPAGRRRALRGRRAARARWARWAWARARCDGRRRAPASRAARWRGARRARSRRRARAARRGCGERRAGRRRAATPALHAHVFWRRSAGARRSCSSMSAP